MARRLISSGSKFEEMVGYSRAVVNGDWVFVAGTTGFDYTTMTISDDVVEQCRQTLKNIESALNEAGSSFDDVVRVHYILQSRDEWPQCWPLVSEAFKKSQACSNNVCCRAARPRNEDRNRGNCTQAKRLGLNSFPKGRLGGNHYDLGRPCSAYGQIQ